MKRFLNFCLIVLAFSACNMGGSAYPKAEDALDAGREFINACMQGDFERAKFYMLKDKENQQQFSLYEKEYKSKDSYEKEQLKSASIIIGDEQTLNDSTHIIHYSNSFDKIPRQVTIVQKGSDWLVDYTYASDNGGK